MRLRIASLGFGNVGRALAQMLTEKAAVLRERHGLELVFSGALTRRAGGWTHDGLDAAALFASGWPTGAAPSGARAFEGDPLRFAREVEADVLLELTTLSPMDGEPATSHIRAALESGKHVVTANKGPIAHALRALRDVGARHGRILRFESTVMDGTPIFGLMESCLPATEILALEGVLNSTSNFILGRMAAGEPLETALAEAQRLGIAEANPSYDLEGWDASVKAVVLANALMGADLRPQQVRRTDLGADAMRACVAARRGDQSVKQVVRVTRAGTAVDAEVALAVLEPSSPFSRLQGMEAALLLRTDTLQDLTLVEGEGGPGQTAFGVVADLVHIARALRP